MSREIQPEDMGLFAGDGATPEVFRFVDCLSQLTVQRAVAAIKQATICGTVSGKGALEITVPFQGVPFVETDADKISTFELSEMIRNKQTLNWKISPMEPKEGDIIYEFEAYLSSFDNGMQADSASTMSGQLEVTVSSYTETKFETT